jgi:hypothetical protein
MNLCCAVKDAFIPFVQERLVITFIFIYVIAAWVLGLAYLDNWYALAPLIGSTIFNYACLYRENRRLIARAALICSTSWMIYDYCVMAYASMFFSGIVMVSIIIGMARYEKWSLPKFAFPMSAKSEAVS